MSYDNEGRLAAWQNAPSSPTSSDSFLYDGEGNRVEQQSTTNGSILTSTVYVAGGLEEITSSEASTTLTKYLGANGLPTDERVGTNGPLSYLTTDGQGSVSETLDGGGNVTSAQLYTPYGTVRYSSGSSPTSLGYTGQRADSATGLDYYHARYYDPVAGQFASADTVQDGLNRYGYVRGNPTTYSDPSGHRLAIDSTGGGGSSTPLDCHMTYTCLTPIDRNGEYAGVCNRHLCPPSPPSPTPTSGTSNNGTEKCSSDSRCGCYIECSSDAPSASSQEVEDCQHAGSHPAWCSRYVSKYNNDGTPAAEADLIDTADYYFFVIAAGDGAAGQYVLFYIKHPGLWMNSMGATLGVSISLLGLVVLSAGVGQLMTKGTPTGEQVRGFLSGLSYSVGIGALFVSGSAVTSSSGFTALQSEVSTAALAASIGVSYGTDTPTEFCPPAQVGFFTVPTCFMG